MHVALMQYYRQHMHVALMQYYRQHMHVALMQYYRQHMHVALMQTLGLINKDLYSEISGCTCLHAEKNGI